MVKRLWREAWQAPVEGDGAGRFSEGPLEVFGASSGGGGGSKAPASCKHHAIGEKSCLCGEADTSSFVLPLQISRQRVGAEDDPLAARRAVKLLALEQLTVPMVPGEEPKHRAAFMRWLDRLRSCKQPGAYVVLVARACGHQAFQPASCGNRWCPDCGEAVRERWRRQFQAVLTGIPGLRWATFTVKSAPIGGLDEVLNLVWEAWDRFRRRRWWQLHARGCIAICEVTCTESGWHPHLHVLWDGQFMTLERTREEWASSNRGMGWIVDLAPVKDPNLSRYLSKLGSLAGYVAKGLDGKRGQGKIDFALVPELLAEFLLATKGRRMIRIYGTCKPIAASVSVKGIGLGSCPECGEESEVLWSKWFENERKGRQFLLKPNLGRDEDEEARPGGPEVPPEEEEEEGPDEADEEVPF